MKTNFLLISYLTALLLLSNTLFGQAPVLGSAGKFILFSSSGPVTNTGVTTLKGHVGTNVGTTTGFDTLLVTGKVHSIPDSVTLQCATDLATAYAYLNALPHDSLLPNPATFGHGVTLKPYVYFFNAATILTDTVYFNGNGDTGAVFIVKINGAFSTSSSARVILTNGARAINVFWKVEGAVSLAANVVFKGTIIANNGAINIASANNLDGRALTTTGALSISGSNGNIPLPIKLLNFTARASKNKVHLNWVTASEINNRFFTVEKSTDGKSFYALAKIQGAGTSNQLHSYGMVDEMNTSQVVYYRLKQTDIDGKFTYSTIIALSMHQNADLGLVVYPNPAMPGELNLLLTGEVGTHVNIMVSDFMGKSYYSNTQYLSGISNVFALDQAHVLLPGMYIVTVSSDAKHYSQKIIIQ
jgi:hypothetical protein